MGNQHFGALPATRPWKSVIALIAGGGDVSQVSAATSQAAENSLAAYADDPVAKRAFFLLTQIPLAAREDDFAGTLRQLGLDVDRPDLIQISNAYMDDLDQRALSRRSDVGEMVALSAVESIQAIARRSLDDLLGSDVSSPERTREVMSGLSTEKQFGILAQDFFARLLRRHLAYYLSRELPRHVGTGGRFASMREHDDFERALETHCRETARAVTRFAGEWLSKTEFEGGVTEKKAGGFIFVAMNKLRAELETRRSLGDG